jgi:two-component system, response regulator PdtaR
LKIIIIDDEPLVRRSLSRALRSAGHVVLEAEDGPSGLELWKEEAPDLAFIDVLMPGMTGVEVIQSAPRDLRKNTRIILMSAFTGKEAANLVLTEGVDLFLTKPFEDIFNIVKMSEEVFLNGRK